MRSFQRTLLRAHTPAAPLPSRRGNIATSSRGSAGSSGS